MEEMNPDEQKALIQQSYDRIAETYLNWEDGKPTAQRIACTQYIVDHVVSGGHVLDLGCGAGVPTAKLLAEYFEVTGVDFSESQIALAKKHVPQASFIQADMTTLSFPDGAFDAVVAFHSIIHVPRDEQAGMYKRIADWLKPGGLFVASLGTRDEALGHEDDWLGAPMAWSSFDAATSQRLITEAGLEILKADLETVTENGQPATALWIIARKR